MTLREVLRVRADFHAFGIRSSSFPSHASVVCMALFLPPCPKVLLEPACHEKWSLLFLPVPSAPLPLPTPCLSPPHFVQPHNAIFLMQLEVVFNSSGSTF